MLWLEDEAEDERQFRETMLKSSNAQVLGSSVQGNDLDESKLEKLQALNDLVSKLTSEVSAYILMHLRSDPE